MGLLDRLRTTSDRTLAAVLSVTLVLAAAAFVALIAVLIVLVTGINQIDKRTSALQEAVAGDVERPLQDTVAGVREGVRELRAGEDDSLAALAASLDRVGRRLGRVIRGLRQVGKDTARLGQVVTALDSVAADLGALGTIASELTAVDERVERVRAHVESIDRKLGTLTLSE